MPTDSGEAKPKVRRDAGPLTAAVAPSDDPLRLRLSEELDYARRMIEVLGEELAADSLLVSRHLRSLQSIDIAAQIIGHVADVTRSADPSAAVERIGMAELKARLLRRSVG